VRIRAATFDAPNGILCVRRARSNTPLQALASLNETVFMDAAGPGRHSLEHGSGEADRITTRSGVAWPPATHDELEDCRDCSIGEGRGRWLVSAFLQETPA